MGLVDVTGSTTQPSHQLTRSKRHCKDNDRSTLSGSRSNSGGNRIERALQVPKRYIWLVAMLSRAMQHSLASGQNKQQRQRQPNMTVRRDLPGSAVALQAHIPFLAVLHPLSAPAAVAPGRVGQSCAGSHDLIPGTGNRRHLKLH